MTSALLIGSKTTTQSVYKSCGTSNVVTHKTTDVKARLDWHPGFNLDFTPTGASPMDSVERFCAKITKKRSRRGNYSSVHDIVATADDDLLERNVQPKRFACSKTAEDIQRRERRAFDALDDFWRNR